MNKALVFALMLCVHPFAAHAQTCPWGGIDFNSQEEVNNFKTNYPGCTWIEGSVRIIGSTVNNLDSLHEITTITGDLILHANIWLQHLNGLSNLDSLGGTLSINGNEQLYNISGLANLATLGGGLGVGSNQSLTSLDGLQNITTLGGGFELSWQGNVTDFSPLSNLTSIGGGFRIEALPHLTDLSAFSSLQSIEGELLLLNLNKLQSLDGLQGLDSLPQGCKIEWCSSLTNLQGLNNVTRCGYDFTIENCEKLTSLQGLNMLNTVGGRLFLIQNAALSDISALTNLTSIGGSLQVAQCPSLTSLAGLENLSNIGSDLDITLNPALTDLSALSQLTKIAGSVTLFSNVSLGSLAGLHHLDSIGAYLSVVGNPGLPSLAGLEQLQWIGQTLQIFQNDALSDISALGNLRRIGYSIEMYQNPVLSDCALAAICRHLIVTPNTVNIQSNAAGCNDPSEVFGLCALTPVAVQVLTDPDGDCQSGDPAARPVTDATVLLSGTVQTELRPCAGNAPVRFEAIDQTPITLSVQQFPAENWEVCANNQTFDPGAVSPGDTIRATFLLKPLRSCAELEVRSGLPSVFREDCLVPSEVSVFIKNIGAAEAQAATSAVVLPLDVELLQSDPAPQAQAGDTLFFALGDLPPFATATVKMSVRTKCGAVQAGRSLCWETYAIAANTCPVAPPSGSEVSVSATCEGDSVAFVLKNTGGASTQNLHTLKIIKNKYVQRTDTFSLAPQEILTVRAPADGSTWRLEATKRDDGSRTAAFSEGCGGLTPGLVSAFWLEKGGVSYDFDCRQVVAAPTTSDFASMTAAPGGVGATHLLAPGQPVQYTFEFQNPGNDTARSVVLRTTILPELNPATFRPVAASHPFEWVMRSGNELEISFPGIELPAGQTNPDSSRGFFIFSIDQTPGLAPGTAVYSGFEARFDNTNFLQSTYAHTIGEPLPKGLSCAPDGIQFYGQTQVDGFQIEYPGCVRIEGPVVLQNTNTVNLEALNEVEYMGAFITFNNPLLSDLNGLRNLDSCGGLSFSNNASLKNLTGLENLKKVTGDVWINNSLALESLTGLENLTSISGHFQHYGSSVPDLIPLHNLIYVGGNFEPGGSLQMQNLHGMESLTEVGGSFRLAYSTLQSLDGLENLQSIGGDVWLSENNQLTSLSGFEKLKTIGGGFTVETSALQDINSLDSLESIGGEIFVLQNPNLNAINGLNNLSTLGTNIRIRENPALALLNGLNNLDTLPGDLEVYLNPVLEEMFGLNRLQSIGGNFTFGYNDRIVRFGSMDSLLHVGGYFNVSNNAILNYFNGFHHLRSTGGSFLIYENPKLIDLYGFERLDSVGGSASFSGLPMLSQLDRLGRLRHVGGSFTIFKNPTLVSLDSLVNLKTVGENLHIEENAALDDLRGFAGLDSIGGGVTIRFTNLLSLNGLHQIRKIPLGLFIDGNSALVNFEGLNNLESIGTELYVYNNPALESVNGMGRLKTIGSDMTFRYNAKLKDFTGMDKLESVGRNFWIGNHDALESYAGLDSLKTIGGFFLSDYNFNLQSFSGLNNLETIGDFFSIYVTNALSLNGLERLHSIGTTLSIQNCHALKTTKGLEGLVAVPGGIIIQANTALESLEGLKNITSTAILGIESNTALTTLNGLENLVSIDGTIWLAGNAVLSNIDGLRNLASFGDGDNVLDIHGNYLLSECAILPVCNILFNAPGSVYIYDNAPDCNANGEVEAYCNRTPVRVEVLLDSNADCTPDASSAPVAGIQIHLDGAIQMSTRPSDSAGVAYFNYLEKGALSLSLPQFPTGYWEACAPQISLTPGPSPQDTLLATFLLRPKIQCPELTTRLEMPANFRGCFVQSEVSISTQNAGSIPAEGVQIEVVIPPVLEVLSTEPPVSGSAGDTLFFDPGDLGPFEKSVLKIQVKTRCDTFLFGHTLCWEAFATAQNLCPVTLPAFSEIKLSATCLADTSVQFTIANIGDAPTQMPHEYRIIRNADTFQTDSFSLAAHENMTLNVPADGATWRMEATKRDDGTRTAVALENCKGLTPGYINAFWLEKGPPEYDFACREVIGAFDPNQKTALPTGAGSNGLLEQNIPLQYTIDFQNTGTDTAYRVLLRDVLHAGLDVASFRPTGASHPHTWQIRGADTLEVLFFPIMLPDSNVNEPASHGFFSFEINQLQDLPLGTVLDNTASIIFDYNPPIITNTVRHTIGRLLVQVDEPADKPTLWRVLGNPTRDAATFQSLEDISGEKRFDLFDALGRPARTAQFTGQTFEFRREGLPAGWYVFRISDAQGRVFAGKIVVVE